jgi:hypothetical protein
VVDVDDSSAISHIGASSIHLYKKYYNYPNYDYYYASGEIENP